MTTLSELSTKIKEIEKRNNNVEIDKAWETSLFRKILLMLFTYFSLGFYMQAIQIDNPWLNAVIPTIGFFLSTLTLPFFKEYWKKYFYQK